MPRPPADGLYRITNRDGTSCVVQFAGGRPVEFNAYGSPVARPPRRRTTRYLGPDLATVLAERRRQRELTMMLVVLGLDVDGVRR